MKDKYQTMRNNSSFTIPAPENADRDDSGDRQSNSISSEPLPEWDLAQQTWQWTWELHWAGLGTMFALLALYALWSLIGLVTNKKHRRKPRLALAISCLLFIFGTSRALFLFINPYESEQCFLLNECPLILTRILLGIALPCISASFSLIHLAFLQVSKLKLYPRRLQSGRCLAFIIGFQFGLALFTEVMITLYVHWKILNIICQAIFILLGLILSSSFIYSGRIILKSVREARLSIRQLGEVSEQKRRLKISKLVKITYITVFVGFASCALQLYSLSVVYNFYWEVDRGVLPKPWPWLILQSLYRGVELIAGCTMAYVSPKQAVRHRRLSLSSHSRAQNGRNSTHLTIQDFETTVK